MMTTVSSLLGACAVSLQVLAMLSVSQDVFAAAPNRTAAAPVKSYVSVIVSGSDSKHLRAVFKEVQQLNEQREVAIESVLVVGRPKEAEKDVSKYVGKKSPLSPGYAVLGRSFKYLEQLDISYLKVTDAERFIGSHKLQYSPTWVVRTYKEVVILEGYSSIRGWLAQQKFSRKGREAVVGF